MKRGELYLVKHPSGDTKRQRVFVVVSRQVLVDSAFSTVICAPIYTASQGLATQVSVGLEVGLKHPSAIMCDGLVSLSKSDLTNYVGTLSSADIQKLNTALSFALDLPA